MKVTIGYAYASSLMALAMQCEEKGCFYVVKIDDSGRELFDSAESFARWSDANEYATATALQFDRYSMPDPAVTADVRLESLRTAYNARKFKIGCYFDGTHGQENNDRRLVKLALELGWDDSDAAAAVAKYSETEDDDADGLENCAESFSDMVQDAEEFLNSLEQRPFMSWFWNDGDFGLYPNVEGAKEDCAFVSCASVAAAARAGYDCDPEDPSYPAADFRGEWLHVNDHGNCTLYVREDCNLEESGYKDVEIWSLV